MNEVILSDAEARSTALDISRSFCVQAPAGSGKTELLTQRFLKLLLVCDRPEDILAFTFTRKAAFEMRQRILKSLRRNDADNMTAETLELASAVLQRDRDLGWNLLAHPQRLNISTIDSFNSVICAQLPVVSGLGGRTETLDDAGMLYQQAIRNLFARLEGEDELADALGIFLAHLNNNLERAQSLLLSLLQKRDQWLSHILRMHHQDDLQQELVHNLQEVIAESLSETRRALLPFESAIMPLLNFAARNLARAGDDNLGWFESAVCLPETGTDNLACWQALAGFMLTQKGEFRKTVNVKNGFPPKSAGENAGEKQLFESHIAAFKALMQELQQVPGLPGMLNDLGLLPATEYADDEWSFLSALAQILLSLVAELNLLFNQNNQADYIHISASALQALSHEETVSDLALRLDYRIRHILVDEFQDTSQLQIELLRRLTEGWQEGDGRTLFIVGDGMQSCYGFRNADVGLFLKARDQGIGSVRLTPLQLTMNFRSTRGLVDWVNRIFASSFPSHDNISRGAVAYSPGEAVDGSDSAAVTTTLLVQADEEEIDREQVSRKEATMVIEQLQALKPGAGDSVAILVRNRSHLGAIIAALREAEISWIASDIDSLSTFAVIRDMLSLLQTLLNQADISALFALLRSPFAGLRLSDIHALKRFADRHDLSLWQSLQSGDARQILSKDAAQRLQTIVPVLLHARQYRGCSPIADWLQQCWVMLGGPACLESRHELLYVERFLSLLATESDGMDLVDIHRFRQLCANTYLGSSQDADTCLQIMTIHKAKGLEFDYVLIPGLHRSPRRNDRELFLWQEQVSAASTARLLLAPLHARGEDTNPTYEYLKNEADIRTRLENTRLLYIAVTRARKQAFLYAQVRTDQKGDFRKPADASLLATIWTALLDAPEALTRVALTAEPANKAAGPGDRLLTRRLHGGWFADIPRLPAAPEVAENHAEADETGLLVARKTGELIHDALRLLVEKNIAVLDSKVREKYRDYWRSQLQLLCPDSASLKQALQRIARNLDACLRHEKSPWLFSATHQDSACELKLSDYRGPWRKEYIVDRTFVADGIRWIIDYKSAERRTDQGLEDFLREQAVLYQPQLQRYADLFRHMEDRPVRTALFFTALPCWHELPE